ncbi:MAG: cell wall-binding repeat-containing protein [Coriobacteriia bacterium]|nr:cell wall-binding repeat-containing protein [Coriobacteriia bacterium]
MRRSSRPGPHHTLILLLILCFLASVVPGAVIAAEDATAADVIDELVPIPPDAYEPDNSMAAARAITVGAAPQERTMHQAFNDDWVRFSAKAGNTYIIEVLYPDMVGLQVQSMIDWTYEGLPDAPVGLALYDSAGNRLKGGGLMMISGEPSVPPADALAEAAAGGVEGISAEDGSIESITMAHMTLLWKAQANDTLYVQAQQVELVDEYRGLGQYLLSVRAVVPNITGRVTGPGGEPLSNAHVVASQGPLNGVDGIDKPIGPTFAEAFTDVDGDYVLYGLEPGAYTVKFEYWYRNYRPEYYEESFTEASATPVPVTGGLIGATGIDAQLGQYESQISGRVVNESGEPIEGVIVQPYVWAGWGYSSWYMTIETDANGEYSVSNLPSGYSHYTVGFTDPNNTQRYVGEYWDDQPNLSSASAIQLTEEVYPGYYRAPGTYDATLTAVPHVFSGTLTDALGRPIEEGVVRILDAATSAQITSVYTDEKGKWEWNTTNSSTYAAKIQFEDQSGLYRSEYYDDVAEMSQAVTLTASIAAPLDGLDAQLGVNPPSIRGRVTAHDTGLPIKGIEVWVWAPAPWGWMPWDMVTTDAGGYYSVKYVDDRDVVLHFADPSGVYATEYYDNQPRMQDADFIWGTAGGDFVAHAALVKQAGRVFGQDRFSTAVALAEEVHPGWQDVEHVVVASGLDAAAADALASASLCWGLGGAPLLLTHKDYTPDAVRSALAEIAAANQGAQVHVVGGPNSIPDARLAEMEAIVGVGNVERVPFGRDRFENAHKVALAAEAAAAAHALEMPGFLFVANGSDFNKFFDALSASAISAQTGAPIVIVKADEVPPAADMTLDHFAGYDVHVVGGPMTVTNAVYGDAGAADRIYGRDRYATSVSLAQRALNEGWLQIQKIGVSAKIPDALTGGVSIGTQNGPLLTTAPDWLPGPTYAFLDKYDQYIDQVVILGGPNSVSARVASQIALALEQ